jgi:DNA gyrase subunit B
MPADADLRAITLLEAVRLRPAMYLGSTDRHGLHCLINDLIENAVCAHRFGTTQTVACTRHSDRAVTVEYDGDGVSVTPAAVFGGKSYLETVFTQNFAGGVSTKSAYDRHSCHYVGLFTAPALGEMCEVESRIDGKAWRMRFAEGKMVEPLACVGPTVASGLRIRFRPDPQIFKEVQIDGSELRRRLRECAALVPGLKIVFHDEALGHEDEFQFPDGALVLLRDLLPSTGAILEKPLRVQAHSNGIRLDFAVQYVADGATHVDSYVNLGPTPLQGTHVRGCLLGLKEAISGVALRRVQSGLRAVISVDLPSAQFEGPTKEKLANHEIEQWCQSTVAMALLAQLGQTSGQVERLLSHLQQAESI